MNKSVLKCKLLKVRGTHFFIKKTLNLNFQSFKHSQKLFLNKKKNYLKKSRYNVIFIKIIKDPLKVK